MGEIPDFFKGRNFKILLALFVVMFGFMLRSASEGTTTVFLSQALSAALTPFARIGANINEDVGSFMDGLLNGSRLRAENEELKEQLADLQYQIVDLERYKGENEQFREFLDLQDSELDYSLMPAKVIGRNTGESFYSFTIDLGTKDGVIVGSPIVSNLGLVGIVSEVGYTTAKVITILDPTLQVGVIASATSEIGLVSGTVGLALEGKTQMTHLPRESIASVGDLVITSGVAGMFPKDLIVGEISAIYTEASGLSLYAEVTPISDIRTVTNVLVITHFDGQEE